MSACDAYRRQSLKMHDEYAAVVRGVRLAGYLKHRQACCGEPTYINDDL